MSWFRRSIKKVIVEKEELKTLIHVNDTDVQNEIFSKYGIKVPLWMVFCTKDRIVNSHLYFEMWSNKEFIKE